MGYVFNPAILRLALCVSVLGAAVAVAVEAAGWPARPALVLAVMVGGVWTSSVRTSRLPRARPTWQAVRLPAVAGSPR